MTGLTVRSCATWRNRKPRVSQLRPGLSLAPQHRCVSADICQRHGWELARRGLLHDVAQQVGFQALSNIGGQHPVERALCGPQPVLTAGRKETLIQRTQGRDVVPAEAEPPAPAIRHRDTFEHRKTRCESAVMVLSHPANAPVRNPHRRIMGKPVTDHDPVAANARDTAHRGAHRISRRNTPSRRTAERCAFISGQSAGH